MSKLEQLANNSSHQEGNTIANNMLDTTKSDFNKSKSASSERSKSMDRVHSLQESKATFQQNSSNISQDYTNQFADMYKNKYGTEELDNTLRNNPEKANQWLNEFLDSKMGGSSSGIPDQFNQARADFDNKLGVIESLHEQNTNSIESAHISNNKATTESAPANFREEREEKITSGAKQKEIVGLKLANNNNLIHQRGSDLKKKEIKLESTVNDRTGKSASKTLLNHKNPFKKNE